LFREARKHIPKNSFTHSLIVTTCRKLLIEAGEKGHGRSPFDGHKEGENVMRFFVMIYPAYPASLFEALRGTILVPLRKRRLLRHYYHDLIVSR
jgi:hypothetical protein